MHAKSISHDRRIQTAFRDFARTDHWTCPFAVTLTMKQATDAVDGDRKVKVFLDPDKASQNLSHLLNRLNKRIFGNRAKRFGNGLRVIPVLEGGRGERLHYHLMIDCPREELQDRFEPMINEIWQQTQWGFRQTDIRPYADDGWKDYISKLRDKPDYADAIDWRNYHNPGCRV